MFIHCHYCGWEQDDFWDDRYNPIDGLKELKPLLFVDDFDEVYLSADGDLDEMTYREYILLELANAAKRIAGMSYRTIQEWNGKNCPICDRPLYED